MTGILVGPVETKQPLNCMARHEVDGVGGELDPHLMMQSLASLSCRMSASGYSVPLLCDRHQSSGEPSET